MLHQGFRAKSPVEYFEDPLGMQGPCPDHDLRDATVRARLCSSWLRRLRMRMFLTCGSGARLAPLSVTSNASTEAPAQPSVLRATGLVPMKCKATTSPSLPANFVWSCARLGAVFGFESSAPSGGYPKIWDLPCMKRLREQTGARIVPMHMCAWFLQPSSCRPGEYHKKATWWMVSPELFPWVHLFLSRRLPRRLA